MGNDGDHQDDGGRDSKVDASTKKNKKKDNRAHDDEKNKEHGAHGELGELDEAEGEGEDMHFLPESTYKSLESLSLSKTHITKEALEEILSDDRLHSLPDAEAIVQLRIEDCKEPLPELLNKVEPAAFLDKVVKGKAAVSDPKNLTLGE